MFLILSKILPPLIYPLGLTCVLILIAFLLKKQPTLQRFSLLLALIILWAGSTRWVSLGLTRSLEWKYLPGEQIPYADVIVVLGGATHSALYPRQLVEINGAGDRVLYAYWLFKEGKAPYLLLSGGNIDEFSADEHPAQDMASLLEMMGIPDEALWLESTSHNTYENALNCKQMLASKGIQNILLVTSALHMPRSLQLFEHQGLTVTPAPTDFIVTQAGWSHLFQPSFVTQLFNLLPGAENLALTTRALKEYLGILVYQLRGWL